MKKIISLMLCITLLSALPVFAEGGGSDVLFAADFSDNELPSGSDVTFGDDGFIFAEKGYLKLEASEVYPPVSTVLFPYEVNEEEYIYECEVTVNSALSGGCWFSLCFGAVNENIMYQFTVKCGVTAEDSVSLRYKNGASSWKTISSAKLSDHIDESRIDPAKFSGGMIKEGAQFTLAVAVKDGTAFGCIDGVTVIEGGLPAIRAGRAGLDGRGITAQFDDITVKKGIPSWVSAADSFTAEIYTPDTGITEPPVVVQRDRQSLPVFAENKQRPGAVMMTVKESGGELHGYDGAVDLGRLEERIKQFEGLALPAFYVSDERSAQLLSSFIDENEYSDSFVIVSNVSLLEKFKENEYIRLVLDMSSRDSASGAEISRLLYSNGCRAVMLSENAADGETVFELHKRLVTVWVNGTAGVDSLFDSAVNGADAVVTSESAAILSVFEKVKDTTVMRRQVVIADGGDCGAAPDNTLKAVLSALDGSVSVVRLGAFVTKDGEAVLSRTETTVDLSSQLYIPDTALGALKSLSYTDRRMGANDSITTLEELFEAVYKEYPKSVFHIDVKDADAFSAIYGLIKEYEMTDRCVILSGDESVLKAAAAAGMPSAYTGGPYTVDGRELHVSLCSLCRTLNELNSSYYAGPDGMPEELVSLMRSRGMYVCTAYGDEGGASVTSGCGAYTLSKPSLTSNTAVALEASADGEGRLSAKVIKGDNTELDVTALCSITTLSGEVKLSDGAVTGSGVFAVVCPQVASSGEKYSVCSKIIKIIEDSPDPDTEKSAENSDNITLTVIIIAVSSAAAVAGVIVLLYMTGKKRKNDKKQQQ